MGGHWHKRGLTDHSWWSVCDFEFELGSGPLHCCPEDMAGLGQSFEQGSMLESTAHFRSLHCAAPVLISDPLSHPCLHEQQNMSYQLHCLYTMGTVLGGLNSAISCSAIATHSLELPLAY